jgi:tetraacyldisaccharide 4'-kinase
VRRDTPVELSGDEPALLARAHAEAAVVVSPRRAEAARFAETRLDPDLFILDDGMQHLGLKRDCDIVLLRPEDLAGQWNRVIPSGSWREGRSALKAASAFAVKLDADAFRALLPEAEARLAEYGKPLFSFTLAPFALRPLFPRRGKLHPPLDPAVYRGKPYLLVSGVGNPAQVEATARAFMGYGPTRHYAFADHHAYAEKDVRRMMRGNTLPVVCTAKDAVKLRYFDALWGDTPVWMLDVRAAFGPGVDFGAAGDPALGFTDWWTAWWRGIRACVETRGLARI